MVVKTFFRREYGQQKENCQKSDLLYVLNIIKRYSSEENPISQTAICLYLNDIGVPCDRKTVGRNVAYLREFGYPIKKIAGKGYFLDKEEMKNIGSKWVL